MPGPAAADPGLIRAHRDLAHLCHVASQTGLAFHEVEAALRLELVVPVPTAAGARWVLAHAMSLEDVRASIRVAQALDRRPR